MRNRPLCLLTGLHRTESTTTSKRSHSVWIFSQLPPLFAVSPCLRFGLPPCQHIYGIGSYWNEPTCSSWNLLLMTSLNCSHTFNFFQVNSLLLLAPAQLILSQANFLNNRRQALCTNSFYTYPNAPRAMKFFQFFQRCSIHINSSSPPSASHASTSRKYSMDWIGSLIIIFNILIKRRLLYASKALWYNMATSYS